MANIAKENYLTKIGSITGRKNGRTYYDFRCRCGNIINKRADTKSLSCGCRDRSPHPRKSWKGLKFNMLTILTDTYGEYRVKAKCDCGVVREYCVYNIVYIKKNITKSCGCLHRSPKGTYFCDSRTSYDDNERILRKMLNRIKYRCASITNKSAIYYCHKGITVCNEWLQDPLSFVYWSLMNGWVDGLSLDRINNSKGYSPENCRWTTMTGQARNKTTSIFITIDGERKQLHDWMEQKGVIDSYGAIRARYLRGDRGEHLFRPVRTGNYSKTNFKNYTGAIQNIGSINTIKK